MLTPLLDGRDNEDILAKIKKLAPYYVPEWTYDNDNMEPGTALSILFSKMFNETIKRHNQVLYKNQMAFLNMLNAEILPAKASEAYVTFNLSTGTKEPVLIPKGTKVDAENGEKIQFETREEMLATPAVPVCSYKTGSNAMYINEIGNSIFNIASKDMFDNVLFGKNNSKNERDVQEHSFYIGDPVMFNIRSTAIIILGFKNSSNWFSEKEVYELLCDKNKCIWEYLAINSNGVVEAVPFDDVVFAGERLALFKKQFREISLVEVNGVFSNYIRCRLDLKGYSDSVYKTLLSSYSNLKFQHVFAAPKYLDLDFSDGVVSDRVFANDFELRNFEFYPFGEQFCVYDCLYISSNEVLSKRGAAVTVKFQMCYEYKTVGYQENPIVYKNIMNKKDFEEPELPQTNIQTVTWEYWNGTGWSRLSVWEESERIFDGEMPVDKTVLFTCPDDMEKAPVNGQFEYYIRARIVKVCNSYLPKSIYVIPKIIKLVLSYEYSSGTLSSNEETLMLRSINSKSFNLPQSLLALNNLNWKCMNNSKEIRNSIIPFEKMDDSNYPALYIGFDTPPVKGPIHIYFSIRRTEENKSSFQTVWEYYGSKGWSNLRIKDKTSKLYSSGSIVFSGPSDFSEKEFFGKSKYWIRVYDRSDNAVSNTYIKGIYINTTRVIQQDSIYDEMPEIIGEGLNVECQLAKSPVFGEEVFINEVSTLSQDEINVLVGKDNNEVRYECDKSGIVKELWVRWTKVNDFLNSSPQDRHYIIDCSTGRLLFNGKRYGKIFFKDRNSRKIKVSYKVGGGAKGNVEALAINRLQNTIAFVESVINNGPSFGGSEMETFDEAILRETHNIKHRNRAVTTEDVEALAMQASSNISRVRCISNYNGELKKETGCFTIIILPKGETLRENFFNSLREEVKKFVLSKTSALMISGERIVVIGPVFVEYSISVDITVSDMEGIIEIEKELISRLTNYLNPLKGNLDKKGWNIGEHPHISNFYTILKSDKRVRYIENLVVNLHRLNYGKRIQISIEECDNMPFMMVRSGQHQININVLSEDM